VTYRARQPMTFRLRLHLLALLLSVLWATEASSQEPIKPPFGLRWGETTARLERLLTGAKATIKERRTVAGRDMWEVDGILAKDLQRTMFYFSRGELVEVELQYRTTNWDEDKYNGFMGDVRKKLEQKYGAAEILARREEPLGEVIQKVTGWKWNQNNTAIELIDFSAQNGQHTFRTLSVHYKAY
jgi:hypothetical protein